MNLDWLSGKDRVLLESTPLLPAPRFGSMPDMAVGGVRYIVARDGVYVEGRSRYVHARGQIQAVDGLPFGEIETVFTLAHGLIPGEMQSEQIAMARESLPNEWAGLVVGGRDGYALVVPEAEEATAGSVRYSASACDPLDLVLDTHSHGAGAAYFSGTDDRDDAGNPSPAFLAQVIGGLRPDDARHMLARRLIIGGWAFDLESMKCLGQLQARPAHQANVPC